VSCIARKIDQMWFAASTPKGPDGLASLIGAGARPWTPVAHSTPSTRSRRPSAPIEQTGSRRTAFAADAATVLALSKLKKVTGSIESNEPLLQPDPTLPTRRQILGVPLWSFPSGVIPVALCGPTTSGKCSAS
jgi:hypothetical protein